MILFTVVLRTSSLEELNISGCDLGTETGLGLAEVISSGYTKFSTMTIDVSNNDLGPIGNNSLSIITCILFTLFVEMLSSVSRRGFRLGYEDMHDRRRHGREDVQFHKRI